MLSIRQSRGFVIAAGAALALGGMVLLPGSAAAQTPAGVQPAPVPAVAPIVCPAPGTMAVAAVPITRAEFAAQLAKALGKTQAEVERALEQVEGELPPPQVIGMVGIAAPVGDDGLLGAVAGRLGATAEELKAAMQAAAPPCPTGPTQPGAPVDVFATPTALFEAIAQKLGRGITAAQVQAAFEAAAPPANVQIAVRANPEQHIEALARALGVSVEQLKAALQTIQPQVVGPRG